MRKHLLTLTTVLLVASGGRTDDPLGTFRIPDTGQARCYDSRNEIAFPAPDGVFAGQDAQYSGNPPRYRDNGDGTVSDQVTGLMWERKPDFVKRSQDDAEKHAAKLSLAGHSDWRVPTIKELVSIADFRGNMHTATPYIDTQVFAFVYPQGSEGESGRPGMRDMDAQYCSSTRYVGITMGRDRSAFGFNFADGRVKSYPLHAKRYLRCVRGNTAYGRNRFNDNGDGTVSDLASGLVWQKADSGRTMNWRDALAYAGKLELAGKTDWRLPNVKELQSIVDYRRAPDATVGRRRGPAIDPILELTTAESWFWSGTTHIENRGAYYVCFGRSFAAGRRINAHGAGAVRSDPKEGDPSRWIDGLGPQRDEVRILNYVRCVRGGGAVFQAEGPGPRPAGREEKATPRRRNGFVRRLDRNGDGKVSKEEFDGPDRHFDRLDENHDGFLDATEAPRGRPRNGRRRQENDRRGANAKEVLGVVTVGTGSPLYNGDRVRTCSMITFKGRRILVDMGEGVSDRLQREGVSLDRIEAVCFTHHHRDHNADAISIIPRIWQRGRNIPIVGPKGTRDLVAFLRTFYEADMAYRTRKSGRTIPAAGRIAVIELPARVPSPIEGLTITATEVPHSTTAFAYRFDAGGHSVVISGDLTFSKKLIELAKDADILVMDSGAIVYQGESPNKGSRRRQGGGAYVPAHASMESIAAMAAQADVKMLVLHHFRPGRVDEEQTRAALAKTYRGTVAFARDMQAFSCAPGR